MKKRKSLFLVLLLVLSLAVFTGCSGDSNETEEETAPVEEVEETEETEEEEENEEVEEMEEEGEAEAEVVGEWSFTVELAVDGEIEEFEITNEDAEEIGAVHIMAAEKDGDDSLEERQWTGILLVDLLEYLEIEDYLVVSVEGSDGEAREMEADRIDEEGTGFGWMVDGEVLDEEAGPIQLINNDRGPKWWIEDVTKVTIIK